MEEERPCLSGDGEVRKAKRRKPGIVYLSSIPPNMKVSSIRQYFSNFGALDRVFLQASGRDDNTKGPKGKKFKKNLHFTEGWIEFKSKRRAKQVHLSLNNQPVGGKKKNPYYDMLWNIKYLPRFKWAFLRQRLEYEREMQRQRMGAEVSQVTKETDHFLKLSEISNKKKKRKKKEEVEGKEKKEEEEEGGNREKPFIFKQRETEEEKMSKREVRRRKSELFKKRIAEKKNKKKNRNQEKKTDKTEDFLGSVFVGMN